MHLTGNIVFKLSKIKLRNVSSPGDSVKYFITNAFRRICIIVSKRNINKICQTSLKLLINRHIFFIYFEQNLLLIDGTLQFSCLKKFYDRDS